MILVDYRNGPDVAKATKAADLLTPLLEAGLPASETTLEFGDVAFEGRGVKGAPVWIGIEFKKFSDLIQSMSTDRLQGHQLPGLVIEYERPWLVVEGEWTHDDRGRVTQWKGKGRRRPVLGAPPAAELEKQLLCLHTRGGLHVRHCFTRRDTVRFLCQLYRFWTDKDLDKHKSHLAIHAPDLDRGLLIPISDFRRIVAQIPGVGYRTSGAVEKHFGGSFRKMMFASVDDWAAITTTDDSGKTKRIGASRAQKIVEALK